MADGRRVRHCSARTAPNRRVAPKREPAPPRPARMRAAAQLPARPGSKAPRGPREAPPDCARCCGARTLLLLRTHPAAAARARRAGEASGFIMPELYRAEHEPWINRPGPRPLGRAEQDPAAAAGPGRFLSQWTARTRTEGPRRPQDLADPDENGPGPGRTHRRAGRRRAATDRVRMCAGACARRERAARGRRGSLARPAACRLSNPRPPSRTTTHPPTLTSPHPPPPTHPSTHPPEHAHT